MFSINTTVRRIRKTNINSEKGNGSENFVHTENMSKTNREIWNSLHEYKI